MNSPALLEIWKIAKEFQGIKAVDSVSFSVNRGCVTGLIGPNGSGKTTTMNLITGLYSADAGKIIFDGVELVGLAPDQIAALGVARTFQNFRLLSDQSVLENVIFGLYRHFKTGFVSSLLRLPTASREEKSLMETSRDMLRQLEIDHLTNIAVGELSYGDRRRVEIARALVSNPRLLLLDEPAAGMNLSEKRRLADIIHLIRSRGITTILIEHDMEMVAAVSDSLVVLNFGREIFKGLPEDAKKSSEVIEAYLGQEENA